MNFITIRENITQQQAHSILNKLDEMAQVHEIAAFCGSRILYIDYIAGQIKYRFVSRIPNPQRNVAEISRTEVLQLILNRNYLPLGCPNLQNRYPLKQSQHVTTYFPYTKGKIVI